MGTTTPPDDDTNALTNLSPGNHARLSPILILYSHGRTPPLNPPPDLKFDLRTIPNPPKSARDAHDGRSKRLRAHLLADARFVRKLEDVEGEIKEAMLGKVDSKSSTHEGEEEKSTALEQGGSSQEDANLATVDEDPETAVLRVGCNCALGHHRSVAFVEELARREWPHDWRVETVHRDVDKKRSAGTRARQKEWWRSVRQKNSSADGEENAC